MGAAYSNNDFFRMGATVAVGELYASGRLGEGESAARDAGAFLASFGVRTMDDVRSLGICGPYIEDFEGLFAPSAC